jgi:alpha-ketoglutarate-dependent taurine dioxygenase
VEEHSAVITTEKLGDSVGAQVHGVTREQLLHDDDLPTWTLQALEDNGALVFRDLHLDDEAQVVFSRKLGKVEIFGKGEHPEIFRVTLDPAKNPSAQYLRGTFDWHIDGCTDDIPIMATMLSAHAVAERGGETEFASSYAAYEMLDDDEQARLEDVRVVHTIEASQRLFNENPSEKEVENWRKRPAKEHPLVWRHRSGRKSLVLGATTDHVVGMDADAGRALLDDLLHRATTPDRVYRHEWQVGDLVIWDNRGVLHRALPYDPTSPRDMHRTTFAGDEPIQ